MKHPAFRIAAVAFLVAVLLFSAFGALGKLRFAEPYLGIFNPTVTDSGASTAPPAAPETLRVAYNKNDSLNPWTAVSQLNQTLLPLLYDPLVKISPGYEPELCLAQSVEMVGNRCLVTLRPDITFSNGVRVTPQDVLASYEAARKHPTRYRALVEEVTECVLLENGTIQFTLVRADTAFPALLAFPITPAGADNTLHSLPGTGRYRLEATGERYVLKLRPGHIQGDSAIKTIELAELPDDTALLYSLKTGAVDYLFSDLSAPESYNIGSHSMGVELGNILYLGANQTHPLLGQTAFRQMLEGYLSRDSLAARVYSNRATGAETPFPKSYYTLPDLPAPTPPTPEEREIALEQLGLGEQDPDGYRLYEGKRVQLRLIYNAENVHRGDLARELQNQLRSAGVELLLVEYSYQEYQQALAAGNYDLFLAEVRLEGNLDITPLLSGASLGIVDSVYDAALLEQYRSYQAGGISCEAFLTAFDTVQPFFPLLYRQGMVAYSRGLSANIVPTGQDIFYNIQQW